MNAFLSSNSPTRKFAERTIVLPNQSGKTLVPVERRRHLMFHPTIQSLIVPH